MTDTSDATVGTRRAGRSPSYPGIDLPTAIGRVKTLYDREKQHGIPIETVYRHWGYSFGSGGGTTALAALKKFGLVDDKGSGRDRIISVTDLAVDIIGNPNASERAAATKKAAMLPTIHAEMRAKYPTDLPSDSTLEWELVRQRGFTESGAKEFIANYRTTLAHAGLDKGGTVDLEDLEDDEETNDDETSRQAAARAAQLAEEERRRQQRRTGVLTIPVLLEDSASPVVVEFPGKLTPGDWDYFMAQLALMKRGVVQKPEAPLTHPNDSHDAGAGFRATDD